MSLNLPQKLITAVLAALMLLAQSAQVAHDLAHQAHDATELCQSFANHDNTKSMVNIAAEISLPAAVEMDFEWVCSSQTIAATFPASVPRAPPLLS